MSNLPVLSVKNLKTGFQTESGMLLAVDDLSFDLFKGKTLGIVGESGCGKSVTSLSIMRLVPQPNGKILSGSIEFNGKNLLDLPLNQMRKIRGNQISMIFQEPMTSLNPVFSIGNQIKEVIQLHQNLSKAEAQNKAIELLKLVGIPAPEKRINDFPYQLSGGMRQRIMIAMAIACDPDVLIADEPTTALDVTIQAQILDLLRNLQSTLGMSLVLITHDLGVVAEMADDVMVMYAGQAVEYSSVKELFSNPSHPYTQGLLRSVPRISYGAIQSADKSKKRLETIPGIVPHLLNLPKGCRFQDRCQIAQDVCKKDDIPFEKLSVNSTHQTRCLFKGKGNNS